MVIRKKKLKSSMAGVLSTEQRIFIVKNYYETKSYSEVGRRFGIRFPERQVPSKNAMWYNVRKFEQHGTCLDRLEKNVGRKRTVRSRENIEAVETALQNNPSGVSCKFAFTFAYCS